MVDNNCAFWHYLKRKQMYSCDAERCRIVFFCKLSMQQRERNGIAANALRRCVKRQLPFQNAVPLITWFVLWLICAKFKLFN